MADIRIEHARDEGGHPRPGLLVAYVDGRPVASAGRVYGLVDVWIAHRLGTYGHRTNLSEVAAREILLTSASEATS